MNDASISALAKTILGGIDRSKLETPVNTEALKLLLEKLIELAEPAHHQKLADSAQRSVMGAIAERKP